MHLGQREQQSGEALAAGHDAEIGGLLDRVRRVEAGVGQADDLGARRLRLQQEGGIVGRAERVAHRAEHLAPLFLHEIGGLLLQRMAEGVVDGDEVPAIAALGDQRAAGADGLRMGVVGPVEAVGRARLAGQVRGGRAGDDVDLLLLGRDALHGQRHRRGGQFHDRVDLLGVVPLARDVGGDVGLVLVVGVDDLDRRALHLAAEILDRHLGGLDRPLAAEIGIDARLVVQDADLDLAVGDVGGGRDDRGRQQSGRDNWQSFHGVPPLLAIARQRAAAYSAGRERPTETGLQVACAPPRRLATRRVPTRLTCLNLHTLRT